MKTKIGFIGLGIMGKPMVKNLLKASNDVVVYDIARENIDLMVEAGAIPAASAKEVAELCTTIITMLPNGPEVETVVCGNSGILEGATAGTIIVDMSSIAPGVAQEIHKICASKGIKMLDAPVSGGEPKAIDGTLSIMVGGDKAVFDQVYPILMQMGASAVLCGEIGAGNTTKLANQIIVALNIAALSEAFTLSTRAGVDPTKVLDAIKGGLAGSNVMNAKAPMMIDGNYKPGFKIDLHIKDLDNALKTANELGMPAPLTTHAMEILQGLQASGYGQNDHSAIAKHYEKLTGTKISGE